MATLRNRVFRSFLWLLLGMVLSASIFSERLQAATEFEDFIYLSSQSISSAGTESTLPESSKAFIFNPAAVPKVYFPLISHSHSARHFPRRVSSWPEMDQLDCDIESIILPSLIGRFGYAFSLKDELGYDYTNHPEGAFGFPREKLEGSEVLSAYAIGGFPLSLGASIRKFNYRFYPFSEANQKRDVRNILLGPRDQAWLKDGEGQGFGVLAGLPFLRASSSVLRYDVDKVDLPSGKTYSSSLRDRREGFRLFVTAWLSIGLEKRTITQKKLGTRDPEASKVEKEERFSCLGLRPFPFLGLGIGKWAGKRALGLKLQLGPFNLSYSEIKDFLHLIVENSARLMEDLHFYGFEISLV